MKKFFALAVLSMVQYVIVVGQTPVVSPASFFLDDKVLDVTVTTNIKNLRRNKMKPVWQPANISIKLNDTLTVSETIRVQVRGKIRKTLCDIATLQFDFSNPTSPKLSKLRKLKWVGGCQNNRFGNELLLREYLVYKMYNQLTPLSFRVRLLNVQYVDSDQKVRSYTQNAFLIESDEGLAERNDCMEKKTGIYSTEENDRMQVGLVNIFEYMIANTDFSTGNRHNVKLFVPKSDTLRPPFVVPYDFDYAGIVDAPYAMPHEILDIPTVRTRLYRGYPRTEIEIEELLKVFFAKKDNLLAVITQSQQLPLKAKDDMVDFIKSFYKIIDNTLTTTQVFIKNARTF